LHREGVLLAGQPFSLEWRRRGELSGGISARAEADALRLRFQVRHGRDAEWKAIEQRVPILWTTCHFGGRRPWFRCNSCSGRVAVLYGAGELFACPHEVVFNVVSSWFDTAKGRGSDLQKKRCD
jgi:hypothetical protein